MNRLIFLLTVWLWGVATHASALTQREAIEILGREVLQPSSSLDEITAWILPATLSSGVVESVTGSTPTDIANDFVNPQWFAFVDLEPCAFFGHPCRYIFIDDVTGEVTPKDAIDWPALDGNAMEEGTGPGERWTRILSILPRPEPVAGSGFSDPIGDYGDAPDGQQAYTGVTGRFPTSYDPPGPYVGSPGPERIGRGFSQENGAESLLDGDGVANLVDADADERMFLVRDPNTSPATCSILYDASNLGTPQAVNAFVNVLVDLDRNGEWKNTALVTEWTVINQALSLPPGTTNTFLTPGFAWGTSDQEPTLVWARVCISQEELFPPLYGADGWDGSGLFMTGEIEDAKIYTRPCRGEGCPEGGPPPDDPEDEEPPPFTPCPGPKFGWDGNPINYFALVVEGVDNPGQTAVAEAAETMYGLLNVQGYSTTRLNGANATAAKINSWMSEVKAKVVCQDRILIYFIAHGKKNTPGGQMQLRRKTSGDNGAYSGGDLASALSLIPSCAADEACNTPNKCCNVTVIIESCYSGQFLQGLAGVAGDGRHIITSSSSIEPSYFGSDGSGGEYSDSYKECANSSNLDSVDANDDGATDPSELHTWASGNLTTPKDKDQTPQENNMTCTCECPPIIWDCIVAEDPGIIFFPGLWELSDGFWATFHESPEGFEGLEPMYDREDLPDGVNIMEWNWDVELPTPQGPFQLAVKVGFPGGQDVPVVRVPLFVPDVEQLPLEELNLPLQLLVNAADPDPLNWQYQLLDQQTNLIHQEAWPGFPGNLSEQFQAVNAVRANQPAPIPLEAEFVKVSERTPNQLLIRWLPSFPGHQTIVQFTEDITDPESWTNLSGPLDNGNFMVSLDGLIRRFYRIVNASTP